MNYDLRKHGGSMRGANRLPVVNCNPDWPSLLSPRRFMRTPIPLRDSTSAGRAGWRWLIASQALNLLLVTALFRLPGMTRSATREAQPENQRTEESVGKLHRSKARRTQASFGTPWSLIESTNLLEFAGNLRRAGCPEESICDILRPAAARYFALQIQRSEHTGDPWSTGATRREQRRAAAGARAAFREEHARFLKSLSCSQLERMADDEFLTLEFVVGFAGEGVRDQIASILHEVKRRVLFWNEKTGGILLPEEVEAIRREQRAIQTQVEQLMTPSQREEAQLRAYRLGHFLFGNTAAMNGLNLSGDEFRSFCRIQSEANPERWIPWNELGELLGHESTTAVVATRETDTALRALLGETRFREYQLKDQNAYSETSKLAADFNQPSELANQVAGLVLDWRGEVSDLHQQWKTDAENSRSLLLQYRANLKGQLEQLLANVPQSRRQEVVERWIDDIIREEWQKP
jgi:hypothetical protein